MLRIDIKTYNFSVLFNFLKQLKSHSKFKISFSVLPSKRKSFIINKSPHIFGRSKEKYYLKKYLGSIHFKYLRKKDLLIFLLFLKSFKYKKNLGLKFIFS